MALTITVQTLPPVAGANAYVSVAFFKARMDAKLRSYAGKTDDQLIAAITAATEYVDTRFRFVGYRVAAGQSTEWPRQNAYDDRGDRVVGVPDAVMKATCDYAFRALSAELMPDATRDESGQVVKSKTEKVGPLEESVEYATYFASMPEYPAADRLLSSRGLVCSAAIGGFAVHNTARG